MKGMHNNNENKQKVAVKVFVIAKFELNWKQYILF